MSIEVMKQALEFLDGLGRNHWGNRRAVMDALRAAIEQAEKSTLTFDELAHKLVSLNLIQEDAIDDPEGYDGGMRIQAIEVLHRFITIGEEL